MEKMKKKRFGFSVGKDFKPVGIFNIHDLIADIIRRLNEINQWMAEVSQRLFRYLNQAKSGGNFLKQLLFALKKTEFGYVAC